MHLKFEADPSITETLSLQLIPVLWMNTDLLSAHCPPCLHILKKAPVASLPQAGFCY